MHARGVDGTTASLLVKAALQKLLKKEEEEAYTRSVYLKHGLNADGSSSSQRRKEKEEEEELPRRGTRLQGAYAKVTGYHDATSSCSSGACGMQDLQAFALALVATPVSWNDYTGGVMSDRHPGEQFIQGLWVPVDFAPVSPVKQYVPAFQVASIGVLLKWSVRSSVRVSADRAGRSLLPRVARSPLARMVAVVVMMPASTDAGLANSFCTPYVLSLSEETPSMGPTEKVVNIIGESAVLIGG